MARARGTGVLLSEGHLPAAAGGIVVKAVDRMSEAPVMPEEGSPTPEHRRADALVAMCSARVAGDPDPDRATVVVHVPVEVLREMAAHTDPIPPAKAGEPGCA